MAIRDPFSRALALVKVPDRECASTPSTRQHRWDGDVASHLLRTMFDELVAVYRDEAHILDNTELQDAERAIDRAFLAEDVAGLQTALDHYRATALRLMGMVQ